MTNRADVATTVWRALSMATTMNAPFVAATFAYFMESNADTCHPNAEIYSYIHIYIHTCIPSPTAHLRHNATVNNFVQSLLRSLFGYVWGAWRHGCPVFDSISNNSHLPTINDKGHLWFVKTLFALFIICCHTNLFINASATPVRDTCLKGC